MCVCVCVCEHACERESMSDYMCKTVYGRRSVCTCSCAHVSVSVYICMCDVQRYTKTYRRSKVISDRPRK